MLLVLIDYNRTLYDPDTDELMDGASELLGRLKNPNARLVLISRKEGGRSGRLDELGIRDRFDEVLFVDAKTEALFRSIMARYAHDRCVVIGDYLYEEIRAGNRAGAYTIRLKRGKFADLEAQCDDDIPDTTIRTLSEAWEYLK